MTEFRKRLEGEREPIEGLPPWMSELLQTRGIDTAEKAEHFLHPSLSDLHDPMLMQGMDRALELIRAAVAGGEKILIYGDYDVDGISACTVLLETDPRPAHGRLRPERGCCPGDRGGGLRAADHGGLRHIQP